jgi:hypothetical protein
MHPCLGIQELLDHIFEHVDAPWTLVNSALTCQLFSESALGVLWAIWGDFEYALKLLPSDSWIVTDNKRKGIEDKFVGFSQIPKRPI